MANRVAISVQRKAGLSSPIDPSFDRAPAFVILDSDTGEIVSQLDNIAAQAAYGSVAGTAMAMSINDVDAVISGRFNTMACETLGSLDIDMWTVAETVTVKEAFDLLEKRELRKLN